MEPDIVNEEYLTIHTQVIYKNVDSAGKYLSKFLNLMKEKGELWGNQCPACHRKFLPPIITCGYCKIRIEDIPENWFKFGDEGTVLSFFVPETKSRDRSTGQLAGTDLPMAYIRTDNGDEYTIIAHMLQNIDPRKIYKGMKVRAVWRAKEERRARISDIMYYEPVEDRS
jgi:hypothetical protein